MKVGDLIKIKDEEKGLLINGKTDERRVGTVLNLDHYGGTESLIPHRNPEMITEVLWNTGFCGWIAANRIEVVS